MPRDRVHIIGAGLSGLLAANMLRFRATIWEKQEELPHNHSALLRFKTGVFGTAVGIPFREVKMIKGVFGDNSNPIKNMIQYSMKVTGQARTDRSLMQTFTQETRYIAPRDLISRIAEGIDIRYGKNAIMEEDDAGLSTPIISTIPMPSLMDMLNYPNRKEVEFKYRAGININAIVSNCDAYATLYYPSGEEAYRVSITGDQLIIEYVDDGTFPHMENTTKNIVEFYGSHFGFSPNMIHGVQVKKQAYAKIIPIDDEIRKDFMHWATDRHNIYSLGRYATWRPSVQLDDLVKDVNLISQWISKGGKYGAAKHRAQGSLL